MSKSCLDYAGQHKDREKQCFLEETRVLTSLNVPVILWIASFITQSAGSSLRRNYSAYFKMRHRAQQQSSPLYGPWYVLVVSRHTPHLDD